MKKTYLTKLKEEIKEYRKERGKSLNSILGDCKCNAGYGAPWIFFKALNCPVHNKKSSFTLEER